MFVQQESDGTDVTRVVRVYGEPYLDGFEHQGLIVEPEPNSEAAVQMPPEDRRGFPADKSQVPEGKKGHVEPVKIASLEIDTFHGQAQPLLP